MITKINVVLLALFLGLAPGCSQGGDNGMPPATGQAVPPIPSPSPAKGVGSPGPTGGTPVACRLLTSQDIEAVQGEKVKEAKGSEQAEGPLTIGQCLYTTPSFNKSVSLTLTQKKTDNSEPGGPKEFWRRQFGGAKDGEKGREEEREREHRKERGGSAEREEKEHPAQPVKGVGDEAYWAGNQKVSVLYVLKGDRFLRISIGGPEDQKVKIEKMKELAKRALKRL